MDFKDWIINGFDNVIPSDKDKGFTYDEVIKFMNFAWDEALSNNKTYTTTEESSDYSYENLGTDEDDLSYMPSMIKKFIISMPDTAFDKYANEKLVPIMRLQQEQIKELLKLTHTHTVQITRLKSTIRKLKGEIAKITGEPDKDTDDNQEDENA